MVDSETSMGTLSAFTERTKKASRNNLICPVDENRVFLFIFLGFVGLELHS